MHRRGRTPDTVKMRAPFGIGDPTTLGTGLPPRSRSAGRTSRWSPIRHEPSSHEIAPSRSHERDLAAQRGMRCRSQGLSGRSNVRTFSCGPIRPRKHDSSQDAAVAKHTAAAATFRNRRPSAATLS